jgi:hypothetical protein
VVDFFDEILHRFRICGNDPQVKFQEFCPFFACGGIASQQLDVQ